MRQFGAHEQANSGVRLVYALFISEPALDWAASPITCALWVDARCHHARQLSNVHFKRLGHVSETVRHWPMTKASCFSFALHEIATRLKARNGNRR